MPSEEFRKHIYAPPGVKRRTVAEIEYSLTAPESKEGGVMDTPPENAISRRSQIINDRRMTLKYATLEPGHWKLDGTFVLPLPPEESTQEVGWWSEAMSDENGILPEPLTITREFDNVEKFNSFGIAFDEPANNFCTDFEAFFYNAAGQLVHHEHVTDNTSPYARTQEAGLNIAKVVLVLHKTNKPFRYARVSELDFGVYLLFDDHDIQSISSIGEVDPLGKSFPLPELRFTILNNERFDQLDAQSYAPYMQTRQKFIYRHGLVLPDGTIEFVEVGNFILSDWKVTDTLVSFEASGRSSTIGNATFFDSSFEEVTVGQLAENILNGTRLDYSIPVSLMKSPKVPAFFGNINYRNALTVLAELSSCMVLEDGNNVIQFYDVINEMRGVHAFNYKLDGSWRLGEKPFASIDDINYGNMNPAPNVELSQYYNGINLSEYEMSVETRQLSKTQHEVHGSARITVFFSGPISGLSMIEITPEFSISEVTWKAMYMTATIKGNGVVEITVTGNSATLTKEQVFYPAPWNSGREPEYPYVIDLPMMIRGEGFAAFRDWFLERKFKMLFKRLSCDISRWQNPANFVGDTVSVQLNKKGSEADMIIIKQELKYANGALKGSTKVIGEVNLDG